MRLNILFIQEFEACPGCTVLADRLDIMETVAEGDRSRIEKLEMRVRELTKQRQLPAQVNMHVMIRLNALKDLVLFILLCATTERLAYNCATTD